MMKFDISISISVLKVGLMLDLEYINLGGQYWLVLSVGFCLAV